MSIVSLSVPRASISAGHRRATRCATALACVLALAAACDSSAQKPAADGGTGGAGGGAVKGGLAVVSSDFTATSVSLYDPATGTVRDDCFHSGMEGLAQDLSGDVTLPSGPQHGGDLVVIDRANATITYLDPASCVPRAQFSVSTGGFKSNPHDVISVSVDKIYVTRYEKNPAPTAAAEDYDDGDDIVIVDAKTGVVTGSIVLAGQVPPGADPLVQARPDRGVLADGKVCVTLGTLGPLTAGVVIAGPGRVVAIDPKTDQVTGTIELPDQEGCSAIDYQKATQRLYVSCVGPFGDYTAAARAEQVKKSALVEIDISGATPVVARILKPTGVDGQPINLSYAAVIDDMAFVGTLGAFPDAFAGTPGSSDGFFGAPLAGGTPAKLRDGGAFNLGRAAVDVAGKRVFLPDGDAITPRVHVFDASTSPATPGASFEANPAAHLPPREIAWY